MLCPVSWIIILFLAPTDAIKGLRGWAAARMRAVQLAANTAAPLDSDYGSKGLGALGLAWWAGLERLRWLFLTTH
jgi:hypothetical protein